MKAKRKELAVRDLAAYGAPAARVRVVSQEIQVRPRLNKVVDGDPTEAAREVARLLRTEAKVI